MIRYNRMGWRTEEPEPIVPDNEPGMIADLENAAGMSFEDILTDLGLASLTETLGGRRSRPQPPAPKGPPHLVRVK
jgi:hypothetical protein